MAQRSEIVTVYAAGLIQGVALVTFPAAATVFTSATGYGLSNTEYGAMFEPQAIMAIISSLLGAGLTSRLGVKRIYLFGLAANLAAMALLVASKFVMTNRSAAYGILLGATTCMGLGFGWTVPALNTLAAAFFPRVTDKAILGLNALLGLGTALAPVLIAVFLALGAWWTLPVVVGALLVLLILISLPQALDGAPFALSAQSPRPRERERVAPRSEGRVRESGENLKVAERAGKNPSDRLKFPPRFWLFATFALLYGVCETMDGNWASLFMLRRLGSNALLASVALALFWGMVTAGRVLFAALEKWFSESAVFRLLPIVVTAAFIACACLPKTATAPGLAAFAVAGLGCSALLPLTISFAGKELTTISRSVAGGLIAFYQIGYGIAAFGVGPLQAHAGLELNVIFGGAAAIAVIMAALSFTVVRHEKQTVAQISPANP